MDSEPDLIQTLVNYQPVRWARVGSPHSNVDACTAEFVCYDYTDSVCGVSLVLVPSHCHAWWFHSF